MIKRLITQLIFCTVFFSHYSFAVQPEIIMPGNVDDLYDPNFGDNLEVLALHKIKDKFYISRAQVIFDPSHEAAKENRMVSSNVEHAIAIFRNIDINPGEVKTAASNFDVTTNKSKLLLGRIVYFVQESNQGLSLTGPEGDAIIIPNRVSFYILWAGDLDRDGKLDLIVDSEDGNEKNSETCLLLSSIANKNKLVKNAACQFYGG